VLGFSVVIPTFEEEPNIGSIVDAVFDHGASEVIVVDDGSSDNTVEEARKSGAEVLVREGRPDLSKSVVSGVEAASNDIVAVIDGDGQHPPELLPRLVREVSRDSVAVATRAPGSFGDASREIVSRGAELIAKLLHPSLRQVRDPLSGYFAFRKSDVSSQSLNPVGFKILIEILIRAELDHNEVRYEFRERKGGESAIDVFEVAKFLVHMVKLKIDSAVSVSA
jgi:dolichol-phosphate mannosyltransferase